MVPVMSVKVETDGQVTVVTIDRPERRNAVDQVTATALEEAFSEFDGDYKSVRIRSVVDYSTYYIDVPTSVTEGAVDTYVCEDREQHGCCDRACRDAFTARLGKHVCLRHC